MTKKLLLQTTAPRIEDSWHVGRFSLLRRELASIRDEDGNLRYDVVARDRDATRADDTVLSKLDESGFDELWLLGVDFGDGLSDADADGILRFHRRGGGVFATRDHQDLGCSLVRLGPIGELHNFHHHNPEPDSSRRRRDDPGTLEIDWPNYHSGNNGDLQTVHAIEPVHPLMHRADGSTLERFPAHPHEGVTNVPPDRPLARAIVRGTSQATGAAFTIAVVTERDPDGAGRIVAQSTFHHVSDCNWDPRMGAPSFVTEPWGHEVERDTAALEDIKRYVANVARWLEPADTTTPRSSSDAIASSR